MPYFVSNQNLKGTLRGHAFGFTLVELIAATAIMGILVAIVGGGLISVMESSHDKETELDRKHELNRAADFIADDVLAAEKVSTTVMISGPNAGLFELSYPNGEASVAYFVTPKGTSRWKGPYVLRRKVEGENAVALVDGISSQSPLCLVSPGSLKRKAGIQVRIQAERHLKICLAGLLNNNEILTISRQASARN